WRLARPGRPGDLPAGGRGHGALHRTDRTERPDGGGAERRLGPLWSVRLATPHLPAGPDRPRRGDPSVAVPVAPVPRPLVDPAPHLLHDPDGPRSAADPAHRPDRDDQRPRRPRGGQDRPRGEGRLTPGSALGPNG